MGTWGLGAFENDMAMDWVYELEQSTGTDLLLDTFEAVLESDGHEDSDNCQAAIAAAEVVASMTGARSGDLPEEVTTWLEREAAPPDAALRARAIAAVERVEAGSELLELWSESDETASWLAGLKAIKTRLA